MGQQQLLLVIVGVIIVGIAIAIGITTFEAQNVRSNLDAIINDLNHMASQAYQYRMRPAKMDGGNGDYSNYEIPPTLSSNSNATYTIVSKSKDEITFLATSAVDPANTVTATVDARGLLGNWIYTGAFQ